MEVSIQLTFKGQCEEAFRFYERCLGGNIAFMLPWGDSPMAKQAPPEWGSKILHASLQIGDNVLSGADVVPEAYEQPKGFAVLLSVDSPEDADRAFNALAENGTVRVPIQETFWAVRFGMLVDRFGTPWEIHCEQGSESI